MLSLIYSSTGIVSKTERMVGRGGGGGGGRAGELFLLSESQLRVITEPQLELPAKARGSANKECPCQLDLRATA